MKDYFETPEDLPQLLQDYVTEMDEQYSFVLWDYKYCEQWKNRFEKKGYTFEYGLDATPYNLNKIK